MPRIRSRSTNRPGFTLIELLVVITIIAILVGLTGAAVMKGFGKVPQVQTSTEIAQLATALEAFKTDFHLTDPPPSVLVLQSNIGAYAPGDPNLAFLKKAFGKNIGSAGAIQWGPGAGPWTLQGEECLVFYLGGIGNQGFSYNTMNPTPIPGQKTHGPYFTFQTSRLALGANGMPVYIDAWNGRSGPKQPYAYFSSNGISNGYSATSSYGAIPYFTAAGQFINPNTYQIISAGANGVFGNGMMTPVATGYGADDQANFSSTVLGAGQN